MRVVVIGLVKKRNLGDASENCVVSETLIWGLDITLSGCFVLIWSSLEDHRKVDVLFIDHEDNDKLD
eukprot:1535119-Amphidinium_carterae.1